MEQNTMSDNDMNERLLNAIQGNERFLYPNKTPRKGEGRRKVVAAFFKVLGFIFGRILFPAAMLLGCLSMTYRIFYL